MKTVCVYDVLGRAALISRGGARALSRHLDEAVAENGEVVIDFAGVEAVTPSFIDELLTVIEAMNRTAKGRVVLLNPPTGASEKFLAVARAHKRRLDKDQPDAWVLTTDEAGSTHSRSN